MRVSARVQMRAWEGDGRDTYSVANEHLVLLKLSDCVGPVGHAGRREAAAVWSVNRTIR